MVVGKRGLLWACVSQSVVEMLHTGALFVVLINAREIELHECWLKLASEQRAVEVLRLVKDALGRRSSKELQEKKIRFLLK